MKTAKEERGEKQLRTLKTLDDDLNRFQTDYNSNLKNAKFCNNVIGERLFNVPLNQVTLF